MLWGIVVGLLQAATPLVFWWLDSATVYALGLAMIASVYVGFAVADGRPKVIAVESSVTFAFVVVAAAAITGSPWLDVVGLAGHGLKDLWQYRTHFVANTRLVAALLHGRRLGRRRHHRGRDRRRHALRLTIRIASPAGAGTPVVAKVRLGASPGDHRSLGEALGRVASRPLEEADQLPDGVMAMLRVAKRKLAVDLVPVVSPHARLGQVAGLLEVLDDLRRRALCDPDGCGDVPKPRAGVRGDALEHVSVVGHETPSMIPIFRT